MTSVAVLDLDGTTIPGSLGLELARHLVSTGADIALDELESVLSSYKHGLVSHEEMARRSHLVYANGMADLPADLVEHAAAEVWLRVRKTVHDYTRPLITVLRDAGFTILLISGSPRETVAHAATDLGVDVWSAAGLELRDGRYTAQLTEAPGLAGGKLRAFGRHFDGAQVELASSIAIGNSPTDIELLELVGRPYVFEPDTVLQNLAEARAWPIVDRCSALEAICADLSVA